MKPITLTIFSIIALLIIACQYTASNKNVPPTNTVPSIDTNKIESVSLINLITTPEKYNGRKVRVKGYLHLEFEDCVLYLHKEDYTYGMSKNAVWAGIKSWAELRSSQKYSGHYVLMEGIFNAKNTGYEGMNSGSIQNISRIMIIEP